MVHRGGEGHPHGAGQLVGRRVHKPARVALIAAARRHVECADAVAARQLPKNGLDHVQEVARLALAASVGAEMIFAEFFVLDWMQKHAIVALGATACKSPNGQE